MIHKAMSDILFRDKTPKVPNSLLRTSDKLEFTIIYRTQQFNESTILGFNDLIPDKTNISCKPIVTASGACDSVFLQYLISLIHDL